MKDEKKAREADRERRGRRDHAPEGDRRPPEKDRLAPCLKPPRPSPPLTAEELKEISKEIQRKLEREKESVRNEERAPSLAINLLAHKTSLYKMKRYEGELYAHPILSTMARHLTHIYEGAERYAEGIF